MDDIDLTPQECAGIDHLNDLATRGTYYDVLGVHVGADRQLIQKAYYELSRTWHPDRFFRRKTGTYGDRIQFVFATITKAYAALSDDQKRARYDREMKEAGKLASARGGADAEAEVHEISIDRPRPGGSGNASGAGPVPAGPSAAPKLRAIDRVRQRRHPTRSLTGVEETLRSRLARAQQYFETGVQEHQAGNLARAAAALHLAVQFDPKNDNYRRLFEEVQQGARRARAGDFVRAAEQAEKFHQSKEAMGYYRQALEQDATHAEAAFRLAMLVIEQDEDKREALGLVRQAVERCPDNVDWRIVLADLFVEAGMARNAQRELQEVLRRQPDHAEAKQKLKKIG